MTELKSKEDAEALINKEGIEYVSVRFTDLIGVQQHFTLSLIHISEPTRH